MGLLVLWLTGLFVLGGTTSSAPSSAVAGSRRALLIGINTYQPAGTSAQHQPGCHGGRCDLPVFGNLEGPLNDVAAMRDLLSSPKFGFDPRNIAVLTNPDLPPSPLPFIRIPAAETKHDGMLEVLRKYLVDQPNKGDSVVFYYAGHGSLRVNSKGTKLAMMVDGRPSHADSTLVPSDAWTGIHDLRDREVTDIFNQALDKGIKLTVILDSCHSGSFTRGVELGKQYTDRSLGYDPDDLNEGPELLPNGEPKPAPSERTSNPALVFSAAQQDQSAKERIFGDTPATATPHGAFTLALIQALETLPANTPASLVYRQVRAGLEAEGVGDQTPSLDSAKDRLAEPLFGGERSDNEKTRAAAIGTDEEGGVLLDAGQLSGIDVGSEFTSITGDAGGRPIKLRVESLEGLTHARARVISPVGAKVTVPQVFELTKWIPRQVDALHFWSWPANLPFASIESARKQVEASGFKPVDDPVEQPWTDMLDWSGAAWELRHAGGSTETAVGDTLTMDALVSGRNKYGEICVHEALTPEERQAVSSAQWTDPRAPGAGGVCATYFYKRAGSWVLHHSEQAHTSSLGPELTAEALKHGLAADAKLWANLPPPRELYAKLALHEPHSLVTEAKDLAGADYLLAGSITDDGMEWAWMHKAEYLSGPRAKMTKDHSPGCSTQSAYPVSSDWVPLQDATSAAASGNVLNTYAGLLAKTNGWLNLSNSPSGASAATYYKLLFRRVDDRSQLPDDQPAKQDERLKMYLSSSTRVSEKRWVYVLDIDCHGRGSLLYPRDTSDNRFPNDADSPRELELPGAPILRIGPPFGIDTVLLISTQEPLPDPSALEFSGVGTRALKSGTPGGAANPLQQLLSNTSAGTRGPLPEMPTNWSIDSTSLQSVPQKF